MWIWSQRGHNSFLVVPFPLALLHPFSPSTWPLSRPSWSSMFLPVSGILGVIHKCNLSSGRILEPKLHLILFVVDSIPITKLQVSFYWQGHWGPERPKDKPKWLLRADSFYVNLLPHHQPPILWGLWKRNLCISCVTPHGLALTSWLSGPVLLPGSYFGLIYLSKCEILIIIKSFLWLQLFL